MGLVVLMVFLFAAGMRLVPLKLSGGNGGVDQWTWRAIIDEMRKGSGLPVNLDKFLLDEKQWYPPLFQWLLGRLPAKIYDEYASLVAVVLDLVRAALVILTAWFFSGSVVAVLIAGFIYAITPILITYNMQLNPRGMGAIFLDIILLGALNFFYLEGAGIWLVVLALFSGLVLIAHKMTTQLLWFIVLSGAVFSFNPSYLIVIPVSVLVALVLSGGYYRFVALAHWDILRFWFKNWRWSGSHPVLESPVYGEAGYESPSKFYRRGWFAWWRRLSFVVGFNPWVPIVIGVSILAFAEGIKLAPATVFFMSWTGLIFLFSVVTTLIPHLRCFGQGYLYGYNGAFPAAALMGVLWPELSEKWYYVVALVSGVVASGIGLWAFFKQVMQSRTMRVDVNLSLAIDRLKALPDGVVMCLPQHWHDAVAYCAQKKVLFGGHGYGFRLLQPIFPRFLVPVSDLVVTHKVRYLLTYEGYCNQKFIDDLPLSTIEAFGDYQLYTFSVSE